jgi:hypothetical protein
MSEPGRIAARSGSAEFLTIGGVSVVEWEDKESNAVRRLSIAEL